MRHVNQRGNDLGETSKVIIIDFSGSWRPLGQQLVYLSNVLFINKMVSEQLSYK